MRLSNAPLASSSAAQLCRAAPRADQQAAGAACKHVCTLATPSCSPASMIMCLRARYLHCGGHPDHRLTPAALRPLLRNTTVRCLPWLTKATVLSKSWASLLNALPGVMPAAKAQAGAPGTWASWAPPTPDDGTLRMVHHCAPQGFTSEQQVRRHGGERHGSESPYFQRSIFRLLQQREPHPTAKALRNLQWDLTTVRQTKQVWRTSSAAAARSDAPAAAAGAARCAST